MIRRLRPVEGLGVRRIFRETLLLGEPAGLVYAALRPYEDLCLGWYLTRGRDQVRVVEYEGAIAGYVLVCLDQDAFERWMRRAALRWLVESWTRAVTGRLDRAGRRFVRLRMRDGWARWRHGPPAPFAAHAHINLEPALRGAGIGQRLLAFVDRTVAQAGLPGWFGKMNLTADAQLDAIERVGGEIVHWMPNRTLTWLAGEPVRRATLARPLHTAGRAR